MDEFKYKLLLEEIRSTKTVSGLQKLVRKHAERTTGNYSHNIRLATEARHLLKLKSNTLMPDFIENRLLRLSLTYLTKTLLEDPRKGIWETYENFHNISQYFNTETLAKVGYPAELIANLSKIATSKCVLLSPTNCKVVPLSTFRYLISKVEYKVQPYNTNAITSNSFGLSDSASTIVELAVHRLNLTPDECIFLDKVTSQIEIKDFPDETLTDFTSNIEGLYKTLNSSIATIKNKIAESLAKEQK